MTASPSLSSPCRPLPLSAGKQPYDVRDAGRLGGHLYPANREDGDTDRGARARSPVTPREQLADDIAAAWISLSTALCRDPARSLALSAAEGGADLRMRCACIVAVRKAMHAAGETPAAVLTFRHALGLRGMTSATLQVAATPSQLRAWEGVIEIAAAAVRERRRRAERRAAR